MKNNKIMYILYKRTLKYYYGNIASVYCFKGITHISKRELIVYENIYGKLKIYALKKMKTYFLRITYKLNNKKKTLSNKQK